jgi:hypothetical protein
VKHQTCCPPFGELLITVAAPTQRPTVHSDCAGGAHRHSSTMPALADSTRQVLLSQLHSGTTTDDWLANVHQLANSARDIELLAAIAATKTLPDEIATALGSETDQSVALALLTNPSLDPERFATLLTGERRATVLGRVLAHWQPQANGAHHAKAQVVRDHIVAQVRGGTVTISVLDALLEASVISSLDDEVALAIAHRYLDRGKPSAKNAVNDKLTELLEVLVTRHGDDETGAALVAAATHHVHLLALADAVHAREPGDWERLRDRLYLPLFNSIGRHTWKSDWQTSHAALRTLTERLVVEQPCPPAVAATIIAAIPQMSGFSAQFVGIAEWTALLDATPATTRAALLARAGDGDQQACWEVVTDAGFADADRRVAVGRIAPSALVERLEEIPEDLVWAAVDRRPAEMVAYIDRLPGSRAGVIERVIGVINTANDYTAPVVLINVIDRLGSTDTDTVLLGTRWQVVAATTTRGDSIRVMRLLARLQNKHLTDPERWEVFASLADGYTGTTGALLESAAMLAQTP